MSHFQITHATAAFYIPCESSTPAMTQQEVADALNVSQPAVARLEQSALRKLRAMPEAALLLQFLRYPPNSR